MVACLHESSAQVWLVRLPVLVHPEGGVCRQALLISAQIPVSALPTEPEAFPEDHEQRNDGEGDDASDDTSHNGTRARATRRGSRARDGWSALPAD